MASRSPIIGGNWKMNLDRQDAIRLAETLSQCTSRPEKVQVVLFPPFLYLESVRGVLERAPVADGQALPIQLGAQNFYDQPNGAFTGEVSLSMLRDVGVQVVLVGHSERRHVMGENDELINRKVRAALEGGFEVILCVGEKLQQRQLGQTDAINAAQIHYGLAGVSQEQMSCVTIAYEPVWAIGTGKTATASDAQKAHQAIRDHLAAMHGDPIANTVRIQYGGSVKANNAAELFDQRDIDGGLIGGASLQVDEFTAIIDAAALRAATV